MEQFPDNGAPHRKSAESEPAPEVYFLADQSISVQEDGPVICNGEELDFSPIEQKIITTVAKYPDIAMPYSSLCEEVWGNDCSVAAIALKLHIRKICFKLGDLGDTKNGAIRSIRGFGYIGVSSVSGNQLSN